MNNSTTKNNFINRIDYKITHLQKSFRRGKRKVLTDVNLSATGGECIGILGANGCGKSTLLSILAGTQAPDAGSYMVNGTELFFRPGKKHRGSLAGIGYVPQECPLMEELNALDNLKLWYCNSSLSLTAELDNGFLSMLGIPDFLNVTVKKMSGGMKKRLSIGCALAGNPQILLLDEPGAALDLPCRDRIETYLKEYRSRGNIILLATHEEREIELCDKLFLLKDGVLTPLIYNGDIHELTAKL